MIPVFYGETANDVWSQAAESLMSSDVSISSSRTGKTYELLHAVFTITNPRNRWVIDRNPSISVAFALAELIWIFNGSNESEIINFWNPSLKIYAGQDEFYHGAYGYRIRKKYGIDQIERAYYTLKNNPESRQTVMLIWNPNEDLPDVKGSPSNSDIPCNICSMLKIRDFKLEWTQIVRSNDIFRGVPYNFVQFTGLQEILAGWLEIEVGTYTQFSDSLHLYEADEEKLSICKREYLGNCDNLLLPKLQSDKVLKEIFNRMKEISKGNMSEENLALIVDLRSGYAAYDNIMYILGAYAARRLKYKHLKCNFIKSCSNALYNQMWDLWERQIYEKGGV